MAEEKKYTLEELEKILTPKERIFCHEIIIDWNASRAAEKAGYSKKSYQVIGHLNLKKLKIQQYINYIKEDIEKESGITKLRQLKELSNIAYSSIAALHNTWIERKAFEDLTDEQKAAIESIDTKIVKSIEDNEVINIEMVKIKLYSKLGALEQINKVMGYNAADKVDHSSSDGTMSPKEVDLSNLTEEEIIQFGKLRKKANGL